MARTLRMIHRRRGGSMALGSACKKGDQARKEQIIAERSSRYGFAENVMKSANRCCDARAECLGIERRVSISRLEAREVICQYSSAAERPLQRGFLAVAPCPSWPPDPLAGRG